MSGRGMKASEKRTRSAEAAAKKRRLGILEAEGGMVDSLVLEVTESEHTGAALSDKLESVLIHVYCDAP
jgi:hypothetical protein